MNSIPLVIYFTNNNGGAGASEVNISFPSLPVTEFIVVQWGDGTSTNVYGGIGNRMVHNYGNPQKAPRCISIFGDARIVNFYDPSGDRAIGTLSTWGTYAITSVILPDLTKLVKL